MHSKSTAIKPCSTSAGGKVHSSSNCCAQHPTCKASFSIFQRSWHAHKIVLNSNPCASASASPAEISPKRSVCKPTSSSSNVSYITGTTTAPNKSCETPPQHSAMITPVSSSSKPFSFQRISQTSAGSST